MLVCIIFMSILYTQSHNLAVYMVQCQGGAVERGLSCQSRCWQIKSRLTKSLQKTSSFKLGGPLYHNNIVSTLNIHFCPSHIGQVLKLPGAVGPDVLHNAALQITLTVPEVVGTEN